MCMEKKEKEAYDFMTYVQGSIKEIIDRLYIKDDDSEKRVLITMAADFSTGDVQFTAHGKREYVALMAAIGYKHLNMKEKMHLAHKIIKEYGYDIPVEEGLD